MNRRTQHTSARRPCYLYILGKDITWLTSNIRSREPEVSSQGPLCGPLPDPRAGATRFQMKGKNVKRKCGLIFEFWKIRPQGGTVLLWSRHLLLFLFLSGENQVRTKNPNDSSMEKKKKRSAKTRFLGPGIRLPIGKVPPMR